MKYQKLSQTQYAKLYEAIKAHAAELAKLSSWTECVGFLAPKLGGIRLTEDNVKRACKDAEVALTFKRKARKPSSPHSTSDLAVAVRAIIRTLNLYSMVPDPELTKLLERLSPPPVQPSLPFGG